MSKKSAIGFICTVILIALILLTAGMCLGQNGQTESEIVMLQFDTGIYRDYSIGGTFEYAPDFRFVGDTLTFDALIFLSDFIAYETECYNDSTEVIYDCTKRQGYTLEYIYPVYCKEWIHREPTFAGFIQWLKKRSK